MRSRKSQAGNFYFSIFKNWGKGMKKLFMVLCIVIMFFGVIGCPENSSDNPATKSSFTSITSTPVASSDAPSTGDTPLATPEPATLILIGSGLIGLAGLGRKKFKK